MSRFDEEPDGDVHGECAHEIHRLQSRIEQLERELVEAQKDAERYRFIRNISDDLIGLAGMPCVAMPNGMSSGYYLNAEHADFAIDAALSQSEPAQASQPVVVRYKATGNTCDCHPETCCCKDWAVFDGNKKHSTYFDKATAVQVAESLNKSSEPIQASQPIAVMWQHEETGNTGFVDMSQVENRF